MREYILGRSPTALPAAVSHSFWPPLGPPASDFLQFHCFPVSKLCQEPETSRLPPARPFKDSPSPPPIDFSPLESRGSYLGLTSSAHQKPSDPQQPPLTPCDSLQFFTITTARAPHQYLLKTPSGRHRHLSPSQTSDGSHPAHFLPGTLLRESFHGDFCLTPGSKLPHSAVPAQTGLYADG